MKKVLIVAMAITLVGCATHHMEYDGNKLVVDVKTLQTADVDLKATTDPSTGAMIIEYRKIGSPQNDVLGKALDKIPASK
jgi:type IV pilus biogenesis protein CpaD/CtpE